MGMTAKGEAFVSRMKLVSQIAHAGTPVFAAMASGLEEEDWVLVFVAACKLAKDVEQQGAALDAEESK